MLSTDLSLLRSLSGPRLSPDGTRVVYAVAAMDVDADTTTSRLHLLDLASGEDRQLTAGTKDGEPWWSPDGTRIAFVRGGSDDEPGQLAVIDPDGGEARVLTAVPEGVSTPRWAPDGRTVVVASRRWRDGEPARTAEDRAERPRRITELGYRGDDLGWLHDRVRRLFAVDVDEPLDGEGVRALTPDDHDAGPFVVTSDGALVFASARQETREVDAAAGVWRSAIDGGGVEAAGLTEVAPPGWWDPIVAGPSGEVYAIGHADPFRWPAPQQLYVFGEDGPRQLTTELDRDVTAAVVTDDGIIIGVEDRGAVHLHTVPGTGGETVLLVDGARTVSALDASGDGSTIVFVADHPEDPGELWVREGDGEPRVLTDHNAALRDRLLPTTHLTFERDGAEIDAWMVLPEGEGDDVPLLLNIHGGPTAQYGHTFFDEFQVYARAGYAVIGCNPRGSSGRGAEWAEAVVGQWQHEDSVDVLDLEAAVDAALAASDRVSSARIGIMGGSYGGYATARILARSGRFSSAVVERGLLNWVSFSGTSDIGPYFDTMFLGRELDEDIAVHWAASPVRTAARISTPTLVVHSFEDHRCPPEQGLQLFQALRRAGTPSELLLFPDESHELSRSGSPRHRVERFDAILDWHGRWLHD